MKFSFKFSNLLGSIYKKGNLLFTNDGNSVISPVGNRLTVYELKNNKSQTLPVESRYNFNTIALSPNGSILIAVNEVGEALLISMISNSVIHRYLFKQPVQCLKFSPDGRYFAACRGQRTDVFSAPGKWCGMFNPFILEKVFIGHYDDTSCIDWTSDSRILAIGSKDTTVRIYGMPRMINFRVCTLGAHADNVVGTFFEENSIDLITVSVNGRVCLWEANMDLSELINEGEGPPEAKKTCPSEEQEDELDLLKGELRNVNLDDNSNEREDDEDEGESKDENLVKLAFKLQAKHYIINNASPNLKLTSVTYHKKSHLLVVGRTDGSFHLYEMPHVNLIQSLNVTETNISAVALNSAGDWIALGCETFGQLLVWEWQSETYVLKQQGHSSVMTTIAYSSDGQFLASGGEDGKLKLWNTQSGFCFVTFNEHTSGISAVRFAQNRKFVISASLDGTVRAFDMTRYRNFRTLTATRPVQFSSLAIDSSSEFVAAGGQDVFEIYLWSMKVGRLLEILTGHEGPVVSLDFHPGLASTELASVSWDKSLRVWNAIESSAAYEAIKMSSDCLAVAYRPDGKEIAVASLDGQISFFDPKSGSQVGFIEGKNDLISGKLDTDFISAKKSQEAKSFTCLCYSADGNYIIAGGQSKYVCIYSRNEELLVKKFHISENRSLDGVDEFINRRKMTEFGNLNLIEMRDADGQDMIRLPGAKKGDMASRSFKPEVRVMSLVFSPTNQAWAAASTEGLLIYSLDFGQVFDPYLLEESITPQSIKVAVENRSHSEALMKALRLNEQTLLRYVIESIPTEDIEMCTITLHEIYIEKLLKFISSCLENTNHIEFYLLWIKSLLTKKIKTPPTSILLALQKNLSRKQQMLSNICDYNKYTIRFIQKLGEKYLNKKQIENMDVDNDSLSDILL
ncbi:periodic tryptophan protein 2 homolog [Rhodnius prolixus]|uniref:periodic tryptophan protein 2 homolog n=1 Tax=Rhodnius prolixus TaxID=13249 RepID=UPI003D189137